MIDVQQILKAIEAHVRGWIQEMGGTPGSGGYAPKPHDLSSDNHTGSISDAQGPQFLKTNGSRMLTGNQAVADGVTIDGVDVSAVGSTVNGLAADFAAHDGATATAAHASGVGAHDHLTAANGGALDHGSAITGLGDDDHQQYLLVSGARAMSGHLLPELTDTYDLGSSTRLWRKGWLSELDAVLFAKNTATLVGGWLVVGKNEGALPLDVGAADTVIDFGQAMTTGHFVLFRAALVEYMQVGTLVSGTSYIVTRNLDGSGANAWPAGTPYAVLGTTGDGRIELNAYDTPRMSILQQGATYNAQTEVTRIGDLNGWGNIVSEEYGIGIGDYAAGNYLRYGTANGFKVKGGNGAVSLDENGLSIEIVQGSIPAQRFLRFVDSDGLFRARIGAYASLHGSLAVFETISLAGGDSAETRITADGSANLTADGQGADALIHIRSQARVLGLTQDSYANIDLQAYNSSGNPYISMSINNVATGKHSSFLFVPTGLTMDGGLVIGDIGVGITPIEKTLLIATKASNPTYNSGGTTLFVKNKSLYALGPTGYPANLGGASSSAYLMPLTFYGLRALWMMTEAVVGGNAVAPDLGPAHEHLSRNNVIWGGMKGTPGIINGLGFNGSSTYLFRTIDSTIGVSNGFLFGTWVDLWAVNRNHGIVRMGSSTVAWHVLYYYGADNNRYFEFGYFENDGTQRIVGQIQHNTTGWVYVQVYLSHTSSGNNYMQLKVGDNLATQQNVAWGAPRAPVGNLELGRAGTGGTYWLSGRMATAYLAHVIEHGYEYFDATRGNFEY